MLACPPLPRFIARLLTLGVILSLTPLLTGCNNETADLTHRKSVSELNEKAGQLLASGDAQGAANRLEAALDLAPDSPLLQYNLAIAYQQAGQPEKAIPQLSRFLENHPTHERYWDALQTLTVLHQQSGDAAMAAANPPEAGEKPTVSPAEARQQAVQHYEKALAGLQQLQNHTEPENQKIIVDNIEYVEKALKNAQEGPPDAAA